MLDRPEEKFYLVDVVVLGFVVTVSLYSIEIASSHRIEHRTTYCMNLSAPFHHAGPTFQGGPDELGVKH